MSNIRTSRDDLAGLNRDTASLREREILAPALPHGRIRADVDGRVHEFRLRDPFVGWGVFHPTSECELAPVAPALPSQRAAYLTRLPALRVILLWPDPSRRQIGLWLALPYDAAEARKRFGIHGVEPLPIVLVDSTSGADHFERVIVRVDGTTFYYDNLDPQGDPIHADCLRNIVTRSDDPKRLRLDLVDSEKQALLYTRIRALDLGSGEGRRGLEDRLRLALLYAGAVLHGYVEVPNLDESPGRLIVEWSADGHAHRYRTTIEPKCEVVSTGICLAGGDGDVDLVNADRGS
jgi:hypothetical protein